MATTTSKGYQKPQTGDFGNTWFPNIEFDIQRLNDHNHDGVNSQLLTAASVAAISELAGNAWVATGDGAGTYQKQVILPTLFLTNGIPYSNINVSFRAADGGVLYLESVAGLGASDFYIFSNDPTLDVTVVYTT